MAMPGTETIRFRRPTTGPNARMAKAVRAEDLIDEFGVQTPQGWKRRHQGLLQDQVGRHDRGPLVPSLSVAFRILWLIRSIGAMYSIISDCDEVFNFWEPLHYFHHNSGFQTWELSPQFAIRSWTYVLLHFPFVKVIPRVLFLTKRGQFFTLRMFLAVVSSFCEAKFYRAVVETVNERVGRYLLFSLFFSAGMFGASVAFLPSTFTMYTTALAFSYSFHPATSTTTGQRRALKATVWIAMGAILGWPFSAALGIPFVMEQLFLTGGEVAVGGARQGLAVKRLSTMGFATAVGACIAIPVYFVDSWAYGRPTLPVLNILRYNLLSGNGPNLYGTSPWHYYLANLSLNFNILLPLALGALPALAITYVFDHKRLGKTQVKPIPGQTSPYTLLIMRLLPFYLWLGILSAQPHKEERFFFPAYPLLCFNAAVSVFLVKGWMETYYIYVTKSPYRAGRTAIFSNFTLFAILFPGMLSLGRILATYRFYHAPLDVALYFQAGTLPVVLGKLGYTPTLPPKSYNPGPGEKIKPIWDYSVLLDLEPRVRLCYAGEWYRYPGTYFIPDGVDVSFVQTEFDGMLPRPWEPSGETDSVWPREETRVTRLGRFNGENKASAEGGAYVQANQCDFLVAYQAPSQVYTKLEPDWVSDPAWEVDRCFRFLDGPSSAWWSRLVDLPFYDALERGRVWGKYCLLRRKGGPYNQ